jgi:sugar phosphate isomerase/epimerase
VLAIHALSLSEDAAAVEAEAERLARMGVELGAHYLQCGATRPVAASAEGARRAQAVAARAGLALALEFLPFLPVASIAAARALAAAAGLPRRSLCVDTWHFFHGPDDWETLAGVDASEIAFVQFDDHPELASGDLFHETTQRRVLPGDGVFDLERFVRTLRGAGFAGVVGLELLSEAWRGEPPERTAAELLARGRRYWR